MFAKLILDLLGLAPLVGERLALLSASPSLVREVRSPYVFSNAFGRVSLFSLSLMCVAGWGGFS